MELQQSSLYAEYVKQLGWTVLTLDGVQIFLKKIPFMGVLAKIQRPDALPYLPKLVPLLKKHGVRRLAIAPARNTDPEAFSEYKRSLSVFVPLHTEPFLPTTTIIVDLRESEKKIFKRMTEAKQRAVRRAIKHSVVIQESHCITDLIKIKSISAGFLGDITTYGLDILWNTFYPGHATILLAYSLSSRENDSKRSDLYNKDCFSSRSKNRNDNELVGGILLLFYNHIAYYWIAGATKKGKRLFAPTLLVWEALKISKKRGCTQFDFVGVFDQRTPKQFISWKGFTKFKEGFGGEEQYYPIIK